MPEAIPSSWAGKFLHGQAALLLLWRLRSVPGVVAVNVPYFVNESSSPNSAVQNSLR